MTVMTLRCTALDTLFFRESRPHETIGGSELTSLFPPPPRTVAGAIRTAVGESLGVDWLAFLNAAKNGKPYEIGGVDLSRLIGGQGDDLGELALEALWLVHGNERLYPAPRFLMRKEDDFARLRISSGVHTYLGRVRLPELPAEKVGYQPMENVWLTRAGLEKVLAGNLPAASEVFDKEPLFAEEPRLGIARNNSRRTVETGLLYQTCHVRPRRGVAIEADVAGLNEALLTNRIVRLGAEGRMAVFEAAPGPVFPAAPKPAKDTRGLIITLLTPARFVSSGKAAWLPPGFEPAEENGFGVWKGTINGIAITAHCAVIGKAQREGGWDMALHQPRAVQSLTPAGSCYYCTVDDGNIAAAIETLHGKAIGEDRKLGRGRVACGLWIRN